MNGELMRSANDCFDAHRGQAERIIRGSSVVALSKYKLSPELRAKLIAEKKLTIRAEGTKGVWSRPSPKRITPNQAQKAEFLAMDADGKRIEQIATHFGWSYTTTWRLRVFLLAEKASSQRADANGAARGKARVGLGVG